MAPSKLRKAIGAVKDQTSISLAKVGGGASISDLDVAIVKATKHDDYPADDKYIEEILRLTTNNIHHVEACVLTISKRLNKTRNWVVALKALMLINRLINDGDRAFAEAIFYSTKRETRLLNMQYFKDSRLDCHDFSSFVRAYAQFIDSKLKFGLPPGKEKSGSVMCPIVAYPKAERESFPSPERVTPMRGRMVYRLTAGDSSRRERNDSPPRNREESLSPRRGTGRYRGEDSLSLRGTPRRGWESYEEHNRRISPPPGRGTPRRRRDPCEEHDRKNSPSPVKGRLRCGKKNIPSPARSRYDREISPSSARATPRHDRRNSPSPVRGRSRHDRKISPSPVRGRPRHDKETSPYPERATPRHDSPSPVRARSRRDRETSLSPTRATPRHDRKNTPSPERARPRWGRKNSPSPGRTTSRSDRKNSYSPERATPRHDRVYSPSPREARTGRGRYMSPPSARATPNRDGMNSPYTRRVRSRHERNTSISSDKGTPMCDRDNGRLFSRMEKLVELLDHFLACQPTGQAKHDRIVFAALCQVVKESFRLYYHIGEILNIFGKRLESFDVLESVEAFKIFCHVSKQFDKLKNFYKWCYDKGIAREFKRFYPEVELIEQEKLDAMEEYVRAKSVLDHKKETYESEEDKKSKIIEEDMNAIKALPPPEVFQEEPEEQQKEEDVKKDEENCTQKEADLLGLGQGTLTGEEYGDRLALALFDGGTPATEPWKAFEETEDWETALVQSTSYLSNQKASYPGGFDTMLLNGMYQHGAATQAANSTGYSTSGSPSSVALGSAGRPITLALPPPPGTMGSTPALTTIDPFAASLVVPPPSYVQMSELENKQKLLVQEQLMWQQYSREGMQGQVGFTQMQPNPYAYNMGGYYTNTY